MAFKDRIESGFIAAAVFFFFIHNKRGIRLGPEADGFENTAKG
jgi:hypothetical protein